MDTSTQEKCINALQRGVPISERPFATVAAECGTSENEILELLAKLRAEGLCRRFGAIFDARRLGWKSVLCAAKAGKQIEKLAAFAAAEPGVTHCYERGWPQELSVDLPGAPTGDWPDLWFTLAAPKDAFDRAIAKLQKQFGDTRILPFPATRRFKIDVVFDVSTRERDELTEHRPVRELSDEITAPPTDKELAAIRALQGDLPNTLTPFAHAAQESGWEETELLARLRSWQSDGTLRRVGLILRHREIGFKANGMCCWDLPEEDVQAAGRRLAQFPEVTHCYERPRSELFPFRLYAMIHTRSFKGTQELFCRLSDEAGLKGGQLLLSLREFKKTSMVF